MIVRILAFFVIAFLNISFNSQENKEKGVLQIEFEHFVKEDKLLLNTKYENTLGESFEVTRFDYYISNIILTKKNGKKVKLFNSYHLIRSNRPETQILNLPNIPVTDYKSISFLIGIDKKTNTSGVQMGVLDPSNDMFWTWKTGYVFVKLEGKSDVSNLSGGKFNFHVGGFEGLENNIKQKNIDFESKALQIRPNKTTSVKIKVDVLKFFKGGEKFPIAQNTIAMTPKGTIPLANNYVKTYSLLLLKNP